MTKTPQEIRADRAELLQEAAGAESDSLIARLAEALAESQTDYWLSQWCSANARQYQSEVAAQESVAALHSASMLLRVVERSSGSRAAGYEAAYAESVVQKYPQYMPATWPPPWPLRVPPEPLEGSSDNGAGQR